jgi:hypothetical protein
VRTKISLLIPVVALAAALTACGDDGPKKADFVAKADAACAPGNTAISTLAKPTNAPQVATASGTAVTTIDGQVGALRALKAPGGKEKAQVAGIITAIADVSAPTKALQDAAGKTDDPAMGKAALDMQAKADAANKAAQAYGFAQCGTQLKFGLGNMFDGVKNVVKASYLQKAETLCREYYRKSDAIAAPGSTAASFVRFFDAITSLTTKLITDIKAIPTPPGDEAAIADLNSAMDALNSKINEVTAAIKAGNLRLATGLFDEVDVAQTALDAKFDSYGSPVCGSAGA